MTSSIKWKKLRTIAEELTHRKISLILSTDMNDQINSATAFTKGSKRASIIFNGLYLKTDDQIIDATAHECAHITLQSDSHSEKFNALWNQYRSVITDKYFA
jgi:predicted metal-dependent hydrolase